MEKLKEQLCSSNQNPQTISVCCVTGTKAHYVMIEHQVEFCLKFKIKKVFKSFSSTKKTGPNDLLAHSSTSSSPDQQKSKSLELWFVKTKHL